MYIVSDALNVEMSPWILTKKQIEYFLNYNLKWDECP